MVGVRHICEFLWFVLYKKYGNPRVFLWLGELFLRVAPQASGCNFDVSGKIAAYLTVILAVYSSMMTEPLPLRYVRSSGAVSNSSLIILNPSLKFMVIV